MKIIHLIDYFQPKVGYQEFFLAREHQKMGHEVVVLTSDKFFPFTDYDTTYKKILGDRQVREGDQVEEGIRTIRLKSFEFPNSNMIWLSNLNKYLEIIHPDIVFCHGIFSLTSYRIAKFHKKNKYTLIYDTHAAFFNSNFDTSALKKLYHQIYKSFFWPVIEKEADKIFPVGEEEKKFLIDNVPYISKPLSILRVGVDENRFKFSPMLRRRYREKLGIREKENLILYTGKLSRNKDLDTLVRSLKKINSQSLRLILIGGGDSGYIKELKILYSRFEILGFVSNEELAGYYCAADIGIWPGDPSVSILEAMSCGLPIILPEIPETKYIDESGGILRFSRKNVDDLSKKINLLISDSKKRRIFANNNIKYIKNDHLWRKIAEKSIK
jgi:glycosyltransferase involved in cell wall biosynthesis